MRYQVQINKGETKSEVWAMFAILRDAEDFARTLRRELPKWTVEVVELEK